MEKEKLSTLEILLSAAFRPFFLLSSMYSILALSIWVLYLSGWIHWNGPEPARLVHGHEMLFGFGGAAIAGFLLTAVATWTQRPLFSGTPLLMLVFVWFSGRVGPLLPDSIGQHIWEASSLLFWLLLSIFMFREIHASRNTRNHKVIFLLFGFVCVEAAFFEGSQDISEASLRAGLFLIINMILLVAGRIIPAFSNNWLNLNRRDLTFRLEPFSAFDFFVILATNLFAVSFVIHPWNPLTGATGMVAVALQAMRVIRWRGWLVRREPLLFILHVGYAWIPVGIGLLSMASLMDPRFYDPGIHALTYGAMSTLILGVSARVALGHTGRTLRAYPVIRIAFLLMILGAMIRVTLPLTIWSMNVSMLLWTLSMTLFLIRYRPILSQPSTPS